MMDQEHIEEFCRRLPATGRLLGLDLGEATIGLALSDAGRMIATPLQTIRRGKWSADLVSLKRVVAEHAVCGLVVGYPLHMNGSEGARTQSVRSVVRNIARELPLPVLFWDERMSSMAVERVMLDADLSRTRRGELVDKLAASYLLQGALDRLRQAM